MGGGGESCAFCGVETAQGDLLLRGQGAAMCCHCLALCRELVRAGDPDDDDDDGDSDEWVYDPEVDDYVKNPDAVPKKDKKADKPVVLCSFCGASSAGGARVIAGEHAQVCAKCVSSVAVPDDVL